MLRGSAVMAGPHRVPRVLDVGLHTNPHVDRPSGLRSAPVWRWSDEFCVQLSPHSVVLGPERFDDLKAAALERRSP